MAGIIIVAHTPLASAMLDFVEHVYGEVPRDIYAVDVPPHEDIKLTENKLQLIVEKIEKKHEVLILTDIVGATPNNVAIHVANKNHSAYTIQIITGVNLPMLLRAVSHRLEPLQEVIEKSLQGGQNGVVKIRDNQKAST
jgi:PTS system ascorbate-specific IIA component